MKTKNVKVRFEDLKAGKIIYRSHPVFGIDKYTVTGKPYRSKFGSGSWMVPVIQHHEDFDSEDYISLVDAGITVSDGFCEAGYNGRRTFFKLSQAVAWQEKWGKEPWFVDMHERHIQSMRDMDFFDYDPEFEFDGLYSEYHDD